MLEVSKFLKVSGEIILCWLIQWVFFFLIPWVLKSVHSCVFAHALHLILRIFYEKTVEEGDFIINSSLRASKQTNFQNLG